MQISRQSYGPDSFFTRKIFEDIGVDLSDQSNGYKHPKNKKCQIKNDLLRMAQNPCRYWEQRLLFDMANTILFEKGKVVVK